MTLKEEINLPKAGLTPRGKVSIDLMDTEGNVLETHKKDNYVHTRLLELIGEGTMRGSLNTDYMITGIVNQISGIALTDNNEAPNPDTERHVNGNLIGGGEVGSIYDSDWLGNFNSSESVVGLSYFKLVFDFPTSASNGTFQSIYTGPFSLTGSGTTRNIRTRPHTLFRTRGERDDTHLGEFGVTGWFRFGDEFHFAKGTRFSRGVNQLNISEFYSMETLYKSQPWKDTLTLPNSVDGVTLDTKRGVYYFYKVGSTSAWTVWTAPYEDPTDFTLRLSMALSDINQYYMYSLVYDERTDTMIVGGSRATGGSARGIYRASMPDLAPLETFTSNSAGMYMSLSRDGNILHWAESNAQLEGGYDFKNNRTISTHNTSYSSSSSYTYYDFYRELSDELAFFGTYYNNSTNSTYNHVDLVPAFDFFSRAVLDSPVTKTAQNTMKITYEFTVDDFMV